MRTSKISQETTRIFNALSPNSRTTRSTRSSGRSIATFSLGYDGSVEMKKEELEDNEHVTDASSISASTPDIEDAVTTPLRQSRKRKYATESPATKVITTIVKTEHESTWTSPRRRRVKTEDERDGREHDDDAQEEYSDTELNEDTPTRRAKAKPKIPARRTKSPGGTERVIPPSNWEEIYSTIKAMRQRNPTAPVDTMGCEDLFWRSAPPAQKRYHTLTALMLSSQTKDTVTAAAMQRLHSELIPASSPPSSSSTKKSKKSTSTLTATTIPISDSTSPKHQSNLTVENIIASDPIHLDHLIGKVGFHNNKTKFIKQTALILRDEYNSDIPNTIEGLVRLPGVGPKMAYLCMSAAWGIDEGIGVDVHVHRITNLWGWHKTKNPEETRAWLESWLPKKHWHEINKMLVGLGQLTCLPVGRRCGECDLAGTGLCKSEVRGWKATERRAKKEEAVKAGPVKLGDGGRIDVKIEVDDSPRGSENVKVEEEVVEVKLEPILAN